MVYIFWIVELRYIFPDDQLQKFNRVFTGTFSEIIEKVKSKFVKTDGRTVQAQPNNSQEVVVISEN